jgi:hypothetical protein
VVGCARQFCTNVGLPGARTEISPACVVVQMGATYASGAFEKATGYLRTGQPTGTPAQLSEGFKRR